MQLSKQELKLALSLQRRLRWLRRWDAIGKIVCWPWTFYKERQRQWCEQLQWLWDKKQLPEVTDNKQSDIVSRICDLYCGNPIKFMKANRSKDHNLFDKHNDER